MAKLITSKKVHLIEQLLKQFYFGGCLTVDCFTFVSFANANLQFAYVKSLQ